MQFKVPQFIDIEDKVFGPLTFKQFVYLAGGAGFAYLAFHFLPVAVSIFVGPAIAAFAAALAFMKYNDKPFIHVVESFIKFYSHSRLYLWHKEPVNPAAPRELHTIASTDRGTMSESKLKTLSWSLDVIDPKNNMATIGTPAQQFVPVREVRDGIVVMKDGSLCTVVLVSSINLSLKSYDEQKATLEQFQNFLNTIDFPIQIVVQSRRYDVRPYILTLENRLREQTEQLLQVQTREYIQFIQTFTDQVNVMRKSFFVVIPYVPPVLSQSSGVGKLFSFLRPATSTATGVSDFEEERTQLEQRVSVVDQGLSGVGLRLIQLGTQEVIEVLYKTFNPGESTSQVTAQEASGGAGK